MPTRICWHKPTIRIAMAVLSHLMTADDTDPFSTFTLKTKRLRWRLPRLIVMTSMQQRVQMPMMRIVMAPLQRRIVMDGLTQYSGLLVYVFNPHVYVLWRNGSRWPLVVHMSVGLHHSCQLEYEDSALFDMSTQGIQRWTVPETGTYTILAKRVLQVPIYLLRLKTHSASMQGDFFLNQGGCLTISSTSWSWALCWQSWQ